MGCDSLWKSNVLVWLRLHLSAPIVFIEVGFDTKQTYQFAHICCMVWTLVE